MRAISILLRGSIDQAHPAASLGELPSLRVGAERDLPKPAPVRMPHGATYGAKESMERRPAASQPGKYSRTIHGHNLIVLRGSGAAWPD